jgi:hypothetical protein
MDRTANVTLGRANNYLPLDEFSTHSPSALAAVFSQATLLETRADSA